MVSPTARAIANSAALMIPDSAAGTTTLIVASNRVPPKPYAPSRSDVGTDCKASSANEQTVGRHKMPTAMPPLAALNTLNPSLKTCKSGVMTVSAKNPYTTVGTPANTSRIGLRKPRTRRGAYSDR